jgi:hypothetical protein
MVYEVPAYLYREWTHLLPPAKQDDI